MFDHVEAFYRPGSIPEALRLFQTGNGGARFLAGGTDLINQADRSIRSLIDLTQLGLNYIRRQDGGWIIGATTTLSDLESSSATRALAGGILLQAASQSGPVQTRNMATVGGRLANHSQYAEIATPLMALDAVAVLAQAKRRIKLPLADVLSTTSLLFAGQPLLDSIGTRGARSKGSETVGSGDLGVACGRGRPPHSCSAHVRATEQFLESRGSVASAQPGAMIVEIVIPALPGGGRIGWSFQKLGRTESDVSLVNVAAGLQIGRGHCKWARIVVGAVAPAPVRAVQAENQLTGRTVDATLLDIASDAVANAVSPVSGIRGSAQYLREMTRVMARRALLECAAQAGCEL